MKKSTSGFTIVELLIAIVVVAILAAISVVAYRGVTQRATEAALQSDLDRAHKEIGAHQAISGSLPLGDSCPSPDATEVCLKGSGGTTFTYVPNHPTSPTSYQLLATNGNVSYFFDGTSSAPAYGSRLVTLTNLVQNGDFSAGQTDWTIHCQGSTQCFFSDGMLTIIADPSGRSDVRHRIYADYSDGDRIFYSVRLRRDGGSGAHVGAYRDWGGHANYVMTAAQFDAAPIGQFRRYSTVRNFVASQGTYTSIFIGPSTDGRTYQAAADDVVAINLTTAFGAGNEPSASAMEDILSQFENGYFSGTVTATY